MIPFCRCLVLVSRCQRYRMLAAGVTQRCERNTIKLVAYRAETAMAQVVREALPHWRQEEERRLLQSLYGSEADLIPNEATGTLTVRLHYPANAMLAGAVQKLCEELTATQTVFPTTHLRLIYQLADGRPVEVPANHLKPADSADKPSPEDHPAVLPPELPGCQNPNPSQFPRDQEV